jgi:SAM-dependent methyltransferase
MLGFGAPADHFTLLRDAVRTLAYRSAIFAQARDQVVLDLGCGSGVLSIFAAQAGARKVYAVERTRVASLARLMFKANSVEDRITLLREDSRKLELPEKVDLIVHEIFGTDPLNEGLVPILDDARARLLKPGGRLLPHRLEIGCLGLEASRLPGARERKTLQAAQLSAIYGVDFSPFEMAMSTQRTPLSMSHARTDDQLDRILTAESWLYDLDLGRPLAEQIAKPREVELEARQGGQLGGVLLFFRAHLDETLSISTSPYAPRTHWDWGAHELSRIVGVKAGERVRVVARVEAIDDEYRIVVDLS